MTKCHLKDALFINRYQINIADIDPGHKRCNVNYETVRRQLYDSYRKMKDTSDWNLFALFVVVIR
jgi:hypothetical protein